MRMEKAMGKRTVADIPIEEYRELTSTHDRALLMLDDPTDWGIKSFNEVQPGQLMGVIVADHQTKGRGRRDRTWNDEPGSSLLATFILGARLENPMIDVASLMMSVCDVVQSRGVQCRIKWPNDLIVENESMPKLGGCLTEIHDSLLLVGLGINISPDAYPDELEESATSLADEGIDFSRRQLLDAIVMTYQDLYKPQPNHVKIWDKYRSYCATLDQHVRIDHMNGEITGVAKDISDLGALMVTTDSGQKITVTEGDVVHIRVTV